MLKKDIKDLLKSKGVLGPSGKRKFCWKNYWDNECEEIFSKYILNYRTVDEAWFCLLHDIEPPKCPICNNLCIFTGRLKGVNKGYNTVCENCSANKLEDKRLSASKTKKSYTNERLNEIVAKRKKTNLERYGDENYMCYGSKSFRDHMFKTYGDKFYSNREKTKMTNLERYGVEYNFQLPDFQIKSIKKKIERYGNSSNYQKIKKTNLSRYGHEHIGQVKEFQDKSIAKKKEYISKIEKENNCTLQRKIFDKYGQGWKSLGLERIIIDNHVFIDNNYLPLIEQYILEGSHTNKYTSNKEKQLVDYITSIYNGSIQENVTNIVGNNNGRFYELDVFLPELSMAFDFNGTYWHSNKFKDKFYHQRKLKRCYESGVMLIHIYEYDWDNNRENIQNMIQSIIKDIHTSLNFGKIPIYLYKDYELTSPKKIVIDQHILYDEGEFIKKQ